MQFIKEKIKQLSILNIIGISVKSMASIIISLNILFTLSSVLIGLVFANFTIYLNINYNLFNFLYNALPFDVMYIYLNSIEIIYLLLTVCFISVLSAIVPLKMIKNFKYAKF